MKLRHGVLVGLLCLNIPSLAHAQQKVPQELSRVMNREIQRDTLRRFVYDLADSSFLGRGTGQVGLELARDYIVKELQKLHFEVTVQPVYIYPRFCTLVCGESSDSMFYTWNVVGFLPGEKKDSETVFFTAHMDHLGKGDWETGGVLHTMGRDEFFIGKMFGVFLGAQYEVKHNEIFFGADDNASGVASVLAIARAASALKDLGISTRRSIAVCFFGAEEKGLVGSDYFVHSDYYKDLKPIAVFNFDMVGRGESNKVYLVGSPSSENLRNPNPLYSLAIDQNEQFNFVLLRPNDNEHKFFRSDQFSFYRENHNVPTLFFHDGYGGPDYHTPNDTPEKINYELVEQVTRFAFLIGWQLMNTKYIPVYQCPC